MNDPDGITAGDGIPQHRSWELNALHAYARLNLLQANAWPSADVAESVSAGANRQGCIANEAEAFQKTRKASAS